MPFKLVGIHSQSDTDEAIIQLCKSSGVEYSILASGQYPKKQFNGIPHCFVFDHTGKEIFEGHPSQAEPIVEKALLTAPALYLGETKFEKLKALAAQIEKKISLGAAAAALRKKLESGDDAEKAEAGPLLKVLESYAQRRQEAAKTVREENPEQSLSDLKALAKEFSGDTIGNDLKAAAEKEEADPAFKLLVRGLKEVAAQEKALEGLPPCKSCKAKSAKSAGLGCAECRKANEPAFAKAKKALEAIAKKYETEAPAAAKKAGALAGKL